MDDLDIMARTIYGEARGEFAKVHGGMSALIAVGNVIFNRFKERRFGKTIKEVCQRRWQFSCWNDRDPNKNLVETVQKGDQIFDICFELARLVTSNQCPDITKNSNHYFSKSLKFVPIWARSSKPQAIIGDHIFFCLRG
jgi:N-acetylmuramoyl-L-alanine amidase